MADETDSANGRTGADRAPDRGLIVQPVTDAASFRDFVELPFRLQPRGLGVPILETTLESWWHGTSPHPEPVDLVLVRDATGRAVARSTVHGDARLDAKLGVSSQLFGATEFADAAAAEVLFAHLQRVALRNGKDQLLGPVSLLPNQSSGVITAGFGERGFLFSVWNEPWVPAVYETAGFERWGESDTWSVQVGAVAVQPPSEAEWRAAGIRLEYGRRSLMHEQLPQLRTLLNDSFAQLPYTTALTPAELAASTDGIGRLLDERLLLFASEREGREPVAFILVLPDFSEFLQKTRGSLGPLRTIEFALTRGRYRTEAVLVVQGTAPAWQGRGILTLLSRQLQANLAAGGYRRLRSTTVGRSNPASARQFSRFGGEPLHGSTLYRRPVSLPAD